MTSGIASKGVDLDSIFDPYVVGTSPGLTGYTFGAGKTDINTRYAPLIYGTAAPATGLSCKVGGAGSFVDLNTLFAAYGTANYALPINGNSYIVAGVSSGVAPFNPCSGKIELLVGGGQYNIRYTVVNNGGAPVVTDHLFSIPSEMAQFQILTSGVTTTGSASYTNSATSWTAIPGSLTSYLTFQASQSSNVGTSEVQGTVTLNFGATSVKIYTGACNFDASADISA